MEPFQGKDAWIMYLGLGIAWAGSAFLVWFKSEIKAWFVKHGHQEKDSSGPDGKI